jgi:hypothetical protein
MLVLISTVILGSEFWLYSLGAGHIENTALLSNGEAVPLLLQVHLLPLLGVYHAIV